MINIELQERLKNFSEKDIKALNGVSGLILDILSKHEAELKAKDEEIRIQREILKSFESRTCKNCKYFLNKMSAQWCTKKGNPMIFIYNSKATTFSCSEWEKDR